MKIIVLALWSNVHVNHGHCKQSLAWLARSLVEVGASHTHVQAFHQSAEFAVIFSTERLRQP